MIATLLGRAWWVLLLQGIFALIFGLATLAWPFKSVTTMVGLFAVLSLVSGTISIVRAFSPPGAGTVVLILQGIVGIVSGMWALLWPGLTALALVYVIGAWIICQAVLQFVLVFQVRSGRLMLIISGII